MIYASLYHVDSTLPTLEAQKEKWPKAPNHDGSHYLFPDTPPGVEGIFISDLKDEEDKALSGDLLALALSALIADPANVDLVIKGTYGQFNTLHKHPAWRIWCAKYDTEDEGNGRSLFEADWEYVKGMLATYIPEAVDGWPEMSVSLTYDNGREIIFNAVSKNAGE